MVRDGEVGTEHQAAPLGCGGAASTSGEDPDVHFERAPPVARTEGAPEHEEPATFAEHRAVAAEAEIERRDR